MTCRTTRWGPVPLVLLPSLFLLFPAAARADYIFNWGPDIPTVYSDESGMQVNLSDEVQGGPVSGRQNMIASVLTTAITDGVTGTDTFTKGQRVALGLDILDGTEHGNVSFAVGISGSLSAGANSLALSFPDGTSKPVTVNGQRYTVALLGPGSIPGSIQASIVPDTTTDVPTPNPNPNPNPTVNNAPEPSTLALAVLGLALAGAVGWYRWTGCRSVLAAA